MATKKRHKKAAERRGAAPGRKKEIKRFVLERVDGAEANAFAFLIRTSGGTALNTTDQNKLHRLLQHELRALGHKAVRKGQELDPAPKTPKTAEPEPPGAEEKPADPGAAVEHDQGPEPEEEAEAATSEPLGDDTSATPDPDDSDAHTTSN